MSDTTAFSQWDVNYVNFFMPKIDFLDHLRSRVLCGSLRHIPILNPSCAFSSWLEARPLRNISMRLWMGDQARMWFSIDGADYRDLGCVAGY